MEKQNKKNFQSPKLWVLESMLSPVSTGKEVPNFLYYSINCRIFGYVPFFYNKIMLHTLKTKTDEIFNPKSVSIC